MEQVFSIFIDDYSYSSDSLPSTSLRWNLLSVDFLQLGVLSMLVYLPFRLKLLLYIYSCFIVSVSWIFVSCHDYVLLHVILRQLGQLSNEQFLIDDWWLMNLKLNVTSNYKSYTLLQRRLRSISVISPLHLLSGDWHLISWESFLFAQV